MSFSTDGGSVLGKRAKVNPQRTNKSRASLVSGEAVVIQARGHTWGPRLRVRETLAGLELAWLEESEIKGRGRGCGAAGARLAAAGAGGLAGGAAALARPAQRSAGPALPCSLRAPFPHRAAGRSHGLVPESLPWSAGKFLPQPALPEWYLQQLQGPAPR